MKKTLLSALIGATLSGSAFAQSSVTLYGLIDSGFVINSNAGGKRQFEMTSGNLQGSRWGMTGTEDLGGGLQVLFKLESGYTVNNGALGQGGDLFGRAAWVGLHNDQYGALLLGRQYDPVTVSLAQFTSAGAAGNGEVTEWAGPFGAHPADLDNLGGTNRTNNSIKYNSPDFHGLTFSAFYSLGGVAGNFTQNQIYSFASVYRHGGFAAGVGYMNQRDPNYSYWGDKPSSATATSASSLNMSSPVISGLASAGLMQGIVAGALYNFGSVTLKGAYSNVRYQDLGHEPGNGLNPQHLSGESIFNIGEISASYHLTPAFQLGASYALTNRSSVGALENATYNQVNLAADYALSKRTDLYLVAIYQHASGQDTTGKSAVAAIDGLTASSNDRQFATTFGIRHRF
ncbi:porin [Paraburkholderia sp. Ac-20336]|uniref:porin n=1 Tax=Burkholderiaceae TaxID=119060 RepID=UPI001421575C|nr:MULTISPECIES: porin [Burkholderiaceae]MBN3803472.1 porin [Paraburkholderia sp. Ac-20336]MBN3849169.1 porin [Paraburkholderia sp. Ac-20342]NIF55865.1 porin [Burkholderia sp. Ax-1724]NIF79447.1 porin [Paraburkholderia sp. Cy-641]